MNDIDATVRKLTLPIRLLIGMETPDYSHSAAAEAQEIERNMPQLDRLLRVGLRAEAVLKAAAKEKRDDDE